LQVGVGEPVSTDLFEEGAVEVLEVGDLVLGGKRRRHGERP
jgi:hypothetical protein